MAGIRYRVWAEGDTREAVTGRVYAQRPAAERWLRFFDGHVRHCECWRVDEPEGRRYGSVQHFAPGDVADLRYGWDL